MISTMVLSLSRILVRAARRGPSAKSRRFLSEVPVRPRTQYTQKHRPPPPPASVHSIPTGSASIGSAGVALQEVGSARHVFLIEPHLSTDEIEGLAYRINMLTKNSALSAILIATGDVDDKAAGALPWSAVAVERITDPDFATIYAPEGYVAHFAGGYDALHLYKSGKHMDVDLMQRLMDGLGDLALATRGHETKTRIPVITVPHGLINDGGYALCMGSYVMATPKTCFKVSNPSKGLAFDPVGLSFILPRLGWEFRQPSADFPGCGLILALTGAEADSSDMLETGLVTHFMDTVSTLPLLERCLGDLPPWEQQHILPRPKRSYGEDELKEDINAKFRNVGVASLVYAFSQDNVEGKDILSNNESDYHLSDDPSIDLNYTPILVDRESKLVNYAASFDDVFGQEKTVTGIMERLQEISERDVQDPEEKEYVAVAKDLYERMKCQSPLALSVVHSLMVHGSKKGESLESCIEREKRAQLKMFQQTDFDSWARHHEAAIQAGSTFTGWKYKTAAEVPQDEVAEIVGS